MFKQLAAIGLVVVLLASCADKQQEIIGLNNELTTINDSLFYKGQAWGEEFKIAFNSGDYSRLRMARQEVHVYIEQGIDKVGSMKDAGGSEQLRQAELDYLQFERDVIIQKMMAFESFTDTTNKELVSKAYNDLVNSSKEEQVKLNALHDAQKQYADKNGVELKQSELQHIQ
ncbi:MAG: hypothetical protein K0R82_1861 [Flavipsychrobacter sp.]|jgi:hypothetical protein|nr:hypothetical protein [Flavipsychrobacter sp.]